MVETAYGRVEGSASEGVAVFKGIPYARPPVGPLRFRPPQPPEPWTGVRDATRFPSIACQNPSPLESMFGATNPPMGEDCLALNVWTPAPDDAGRPVMVWIHGGAFVTGSGSTPWYDGSSFAARGDVVCVTVNYRLGALGFLHLADLGGEAYASSGNCGLLDQAAALAWVRDNIAAFGGDAGNVTIFGESAGAMSVSSLLALPAAKGLFHRALPQSGAASHVSDRDRATGFAVQVLDALGLGRDDLDRLRSLPVEDLLGAQQRVALSAGPSRLPFQPVVDGTSMPEEPLAAVAAGSATGVDLLIGTNLDEMRLFSALDPRLSSMDEAAVMAAADELFGSGAGPGAFEAYRAGRADHSVADVWSAVLSDSIFRIPAVRLAERQAAQDANVYMYLFTWATPAFGGSLGSCHALEIPFVFNTLDAPGASMFTGPTTEDMRQLATAIHDGWTSFARTGDPNHAGLPDWPTYDPPRRTTMVLAQTCSLEDDPAAAELAVWEGVR